MEASNTGKIKRKLKKIKIKRKFHDINVEFLGLEINIDASNSARINSQDH